LYRPRGEAHTKLRLPGAVVSEKEHTTGIAGWSAGIGWQLWKLNAAVTAYDYPAISVSPYLVVFGRAASSRATRELIAVERHG
jgi:hypothetical protein